MSVLYHRRVVTFTVIIGIATLLSLLLQVGGPFPHYKRYISHATFLFLGLTIGLLVNIALSINVSLPEKLTSKELLGFVLFGGTGFLVFILAVASVVVEDPDKRRRPKGPRPLHLDFSFFSYCSF